jgi:HEPN domain-containing protein
MAEKELIADWIRHAKSDLTTAKHMFEDVYPKETEISAYHCQQCAEKALKAFLIANDIEPPRIHNLRTLCDLCKSIDAEFSVLEIDCVELNPFGSEVRYPNELAADESIVKAAIERVRKVYNFCTQKIEELTAHEIRRGV